MVLRSTVEPFNKFRIELTTNRNNSINQQEYYRWSPDDNMFAGFSEMQQGNIQFPLFHGGQRFLEITTTLNHQFSKNLEIIEMT